jgi:hypothetical protein
MCTLTFIPKHKNGFILTSNRDEAPGRETLPPQVYEMNATRLLFPKDQLAGGTWIGLSEADRLVCLLNGGFTAHERQPEYRISRGIIVTDLLVAENPVSAIESYNFEGVEPFTIVMLDWTSDLRIYELVWDGALSHFSEKPLAPQIWSSSLLYTASMKKKREDWFSEFLFTEMDPSAASLLNFHRTAGDGDPNTDLLMDRGFVKTKSITQVTMESAVSMRYEDLQNNTTTIKNF